MQSPINFSLKNRKFRHLRRALSLRFTGPILAALIMTYGPYIKITTAPRDELSDSHSLLSLVPDSALKAVGRMRKPYGMGEWQFASYIRSCAKAEVSPQRITQTIGSYKLSAGTHARDGIARDGAARNPYCSAVDLSTRDLNPAQIRRLLSAMTDADFPGWYRYTGSFAPLNKRHIHAIFAGYPMKKPLKNQFRAFLANQTGLISPVQERFFLPTSAQKARVRATFLRANS